MTLVRRIQGPIACMYILCSFEALWRPGALFCVGIEKSVMDLVSSVPDWVGAVLQELLGASPACPRSWRLAACLCSVLHIFLSLLLVYFGHRVYVCTPFSDVSLLQRRNSIPTS